MESRPGMHEEARLLLLDTCGTAASAALAEGGRVVGRAGLPGRSASEMLVGEVRRLLHAAEWRVRELTAVAVVRGPGSFTGVRVGLSVAKGLAEGGGVRLIGLSRLEVLAAKAAVARCVPVLRAGRGEWFWARCDQGQVQEQGMCATGELAGKASAAGGSVVCEAGDADELRVAAGAEGLSLELPVFVVPELQAEDGLGIATPLITAREWADPLLLDALYLRRTEQELLERQAAHRVARQGGTKR